MDETDTTPVIGPEGLSAEAARHLAEQRRAQARAQFETPTWIGPNRGTAGVVPTQAEPEHDEFDEPEPEPRTAMPSGEPIPDTAHWSEKTGSRAVAGTILALALAGLVISLVLTITTQSMGAIAGLAASALIAVIFRGALMSAGITAVDLKGSVLRVRKSGVLDIVNLADPVHIVALVGDPDEPSWRLRLEAVDGRIVELGPRQVDPHEMHRIVLYYRAVAERDRRDRERRFNR
jgi:hypothetical protein